MSPIPLKVYLSHENSNEVEIRRFYAEFPNFTAYDYLVEKIKQFFPVLSNKQFTIYWIDEEGEKVSISSTNELALAIKSEHMPELKKLYIKVQSPATSTCFKKDEAAPVHYGVICDECNSNIIGIRYKCANCHNYDLCSECRESDCHFYHPMYRIPHPDVYVDVLSFLSENHRSKGRSDGGRKKRKSDKRESGPERGDEMEDVHHGEYSHRKCKKAYKCRCKKTDKECGKTDGEDETNRLCHAGPYSQLVNEFLGYFNPIHFAPRQPQNEDANITNPSPNLSYLKNLGTSLQKILDPLGVNVEFEVRPKGEPAKDSKNEEDEKQPSKSTSSTPPQKEVRFPGTEPVSETVNQKIEEITEIFSNQTINNANDNDNGWVSYEELKRGSEESQPSSSTEVPKTSPTQASAPEEKKEANKNQNLYPDITTRNPAVRTALENMLAMGYTNEGNWLGSLLEAKNGDINQVLEVLSFQKKFNN